MNILSGVKNAIWGEENTWETDLKTPKSYIIAGREIQQEKLLSEGGYGYVWKAYDKRTRQVFALKQMNCQSKERLEFAKSELNLMKRLPEHQNLVRYYGGQIIPGKDQTTVVYLMEFCDQGSLFDLMSLNQNTKFSQNTILPIIRQIAEALKCMHLLNPPLAHRDIKIQNVLVRNRQFKLCDFGSCSSDRINFANIPQNEYSTYQEVFEKNTTFMYRPPEMCDPFAQFEVTQQVDVWMLGCVVFTLCFFVHPFMDSSKLAICNASYNFPQDSQFSAKMHDFIRNMLTPNPKYRPSIHDIIYTLDNWSKLSTIQLNVQAQQIKQKEVDIQNQLKKFDNKSTQSYQGDIPIEELMKIQQKIQREMDDASFSHQNQRIRDTQIKMIGNVQPKAPQGPVKEIGIKRTVAPQNQWTDFQSSQSDNFSFNNNQSGFGNSNTNVPQNGGSGGGNWGDFNFDWKSHNQPQNNINKTNNYNNNNNNINTTNSVGNSANLWDMPSFQNQEPDHVQLNNINNSYNNNSGFNSINSPAASYNTGQNEWDSSWNNPAPTSSGDRSFNNQNNYKTEQFQSLPIQSSFPVSSYTPPVQKNVVQTQDLIGIVENSNKPKPPPPNLLDLGDFQF